MNMIHSGIGIIHTYPRKSCRGSDFGFRISLSFFLLSSSSSSSSCAGIFVLSYLTCTIYRLLPHTDVPPCLSHCIALRELYYVSWLLPDFLLFLIDRYRTMMSLYRGQDHEYSPLGPPLPAPPAAPSQKSTREAAKTQTRIRPTEAETVAQNDIDGTSRLRLGRLGHIVAVEIIVNPFLEAGRVEV